MTQAELYAEIDELMKKRAEHQHALAVIDGSIQTFRYLITAQAKATAEPASAAPEAAL